MLLVEALGEGLQVDVGGVHVGVHLDPGRGTDVAGGHGDGPQAQFVGRVRASRRRIREWHRVVVGEGDAGGPERAWPPRRSPGGTRSAERVSTSLRLRDVPVLAEAAGQVAPGRAEREHRGAGQEVVERLLLDRVQAEAAGAPVAGQHDLPAGPGTHEAQAPLAVAQLARTRAQVALDAAVRQLVPVAGGHREAVHALHDGASRGVLRGRATDATSRGRGGARRSFSRNSARDHRAPGRRSSDAECTGRPLVIEGRDPEDHAEAPRSVTDASRGGDVHCPRRRASPSWPPLPRCGRLPAPGRRASRR